MKRTWVFLATAMILSACGKSPEQKAADKATTAFQEVCNKEVAFAVSIHAESQFNGRSPGQEIAKCIADRERDHKEMTTPVQGHVTPTTNY